MTRSTCGTHCVMLALLHYYEFINLLIHLSLVQVLSNITVRMNEISPILIMKQVVGTVALKKEGDILGCLGFSV